MRSRVFPIDADSRLATNALLADLRQGRWQPRAWLRFVGLAAAWSARQAVIRPRPVAEVTLLHGVMLASTRGRGRRWVVTSWLLCLAHLGMLGDRSSIGPSTAVSIVRANLPAAGIGPGRWLGALALATDLTDGWLARRRHAETMLGGYADALADAAFWTWFAIRHEPNRALRAAALVAWAAPVVTVVAASIARGRIVDVPQPIVLRPAAALQATLAVRAAARAGRQQPRATR